MREAAFLELDDASYFCVHVESAVRTCQPSSPSVRGHLILSSTFDWTGLDLSKSVTDGSFEFEILPATALAKVK